MLAALTIAEGVNATDSWSYVLGVYCFITEQISAQDFAELLKYAFDHRFAAASELRNYGSRREALVTTVQAEPRSYGAEHDPINNAEAQPRNYTATP